MATRRTAYNASPTSDVSPVPSATQVQRLTAANPNLKSDTSPAVPRSVIAKLLLFTLAMLAGPLTAYYIARDYVFQGSATAAGATAAVVANVVLIGYVVVAMREDDGGTTPNVTDLRTEGKKGQ